MDVQAKLQDIESRIELQGPADYNKALPGMYCQDQEQWSDVSMRLVNEISIRAASVYDLPKLIDDIVSMTEKTIKASASSILLFDEEKDELYFEVVRGDVKDTLKQIRINARTGIAGWVIQHEKPLIVNDVSNDLRFNKGIDKTTGFITKSILCVPLIVHRKIIGVIEVLNKIDGSEFDNQDLETLLPVASFAAMAIENTKLQQSVLDGYKSTIKALAAAVDAKDPYTSGHSHRVMGWALTAGIFLGLTQEELAILEYGAILHDIGKIGIDDRIIRKPGPLDPEELITMREHPVIGAKMVEDIPFLAKARPLILHHHERHDGTGYPQGLSGDDIPISAQIIAIADTFDTMTTDRSYRAALSIPYTLKELHRCTGTQFCITAVDAFISGFHEYYNK
jgi:HD-GYP domain-containing protein (c-di-GMP phosphodiesterase class II)